MRESRFTDEYLEFGAGRTPGTFLSSRLTGKKKKWASSYTRALVNALERREAEGRAFRGLSISGQGLAWFATPELKPMVALIRKQSQQTEVKG